MGAPRHKLVLGQAAYGRSFLMGGAALHRPGHPFLPAAAPPGPYSATSGFLAYYEVCTLLQDQAWTRVWSNVSRVPYAYGLRDGQWTWVAYEDTQSMREKVETTTSTVTFLRNIKYC